jgi:hypothetical protein
MYFHTIGNPIAGAYSWDFIRYNNPEGTGTPSSLSFYGAEIIFAPVNPTTIRVPTGYFTQPDYIITFKNSGGVLSDFKAIIDPAAVEADFVPNGITITSGPTILVEDNNTKLTVKYTTSTRNITDIYIKK